MMIFRFRSTGEQDDMLKKVKKMREFLTELEDCMEECAEEEVEYRRKDYKHSSYYPSDYDMEPRGRYGYSRH